MEWSGWMKIADLLDSHPGAAEVLLSFGLPCHECVVAPRQTLEEGARLNGLDPEAILEKLRALPPPGKEGRPPRLPDR